MYTDTYITCIYTYIYLYVSVTKCTHLYVWYLVCKCCTHAQIYRGWNVFPANNNGKSSFLTSPVNVWNFWFGSQLLELSVEVSTQLWELDIHVDETDVIQQPWSIMRLWPTMVWVDSPIKCDASERGRLAAAAPGSLDISSGKNK